MPGLIAAPNSGPFNNGDPLIIEKKENIGSQMGHTKNIYI